MSANFVLTFWCEGITMIFDEKFYHVHKDKIIQKNETRMNGKEIKYNGSKNRQFVN